MVREHGSLTKDAETNEAAWEAARGAARGAVKVCLSFFLWSDVLLVSEYGRRIYVRAAVVGAFSSSLSLRIALDWEASILLVGCSPSLVRFLLCSTAPRARESCCTWAFSCFLSFATSWSYSSLSKHAVQKHDSKQQVQDCMEKKPHSHCLSIIMDAFYQLAPLRLRLTEYDSGAPSSQSPAALHMPSRHYTAA